MMNGFKSHAQDGYAQVKRSISTCWHPYLMKIERDGINSKEINSSVRDIPPSTTRWYMGRTIRGGPARKIEACTARLPVVLDIVIVPNKILYL